QREKRRENLRHQAEVAPYLGLSDSEDDTANTEAQQETNEEAKEEKNEETKDADSNESEQK
ncbi:hypothetical protein NW768_011387, partial [Fusarium equiseti]